MSLTSGPSVEDFRLVSASTLRALTSLPYDFSPRVVERAATRLERVSNEDFPLEVVPQQGYAPTPPDNYVWGPRAMFRVSGGGYVAFWFTEPVSSKFERSGTRTYCTENVLFPVVYELENRFGTALLEELRVEESARPPRWLPFAIAAVVVLCLLVLFLHR